MISSTRSSSFFRPLRLFVVVVGIAVGVLLAAEPHAAEQLYTCGMHPRIIKQEPGNCPICGMALTPVRDHSATGDPTASASVIQLDAATVQRMNVRTALVTRGPVRRLIRTVGMVAFNERGLRDITAKYEGWIEKLHVNATWASVKAGDPLFEIYSPDLYGAQLNYLVALRAEGSQGGPFTRSSLERLELFDVSPEFIAAIAKSGKARRTYLFRAPADGVVIEKNGIEGQLIKPGERVYRLADLSTVWVHARIYEKDLAAISPGQQAEVRSTYGGDQVHPGVVARLLPQIDEVTRTATARIVIENPDRSLLPGMFTEVRFKTQLAADAVLVPDSAVLRSGESTTVFVARDAGVFEPREVTLGARTDDYRHAVSSGLSEGERVVISGQFMLDSESQLREVIQKMRTSSAVDQPATPSDVTATPSHHAKPPALGAPVSDHAMTLLTPIAFAAADAGAALAADDVTGYTRHLPALRSALAAYFSGNEHAVHGPLAPFRNSFADPVDLASARREFEPFSTAIADLARENHLPHTEKLHVFECPMTPVTGKARWLQREAGTRNPFFGSEMLNCGDEIAGPDEPGAK